MYPFASPMMMGQAAIGVVAAWSNTDKNPKIAISNGGLTATAAPDSSGFVGVRANKYFSNDDSYYEFRMDVRSGGVFGFGSPGVSLSSYPGGDANGIGVEMGRGRIYFGGSGDGAEVEIAEQQTIGLRYNPKTGLFIVYRGGNEINRKTGLLSGQSFAPMIATFGTGQTTANFGGSPFSNGLPLGAKAVGAAS